MPDIRKIWCCQCAADVDARLTDGAEVYPHRRDLWELPFWKCDVCGNHVSCHHKHHNAEQRTAPTGVIPNAEISNARQHIHRRLDPLWKEGLVARKSLYAELTRFLGRQYHTGEIRSVEEARRIYRKVQEIERALRWSNRESA